MTFKWVLRFIAMLSITVAAVACSPEDEGTPVEIPTLAERSTAQADAAITENLEVDEAISAETAVVTPEVAETPEVFETEEVAVATATEDVQPLPTAQSEIGEPELVVVIPEGMRSTNTDGVFSITVSRTTVETGVTNEELPAGHEWVMPLATLSNDAGEEIEVDSEELVLIDVDGNTYLPSTLLERVQPQLVGTALAAGDSVYGVALYAVPTDVELDLLTWCPTGDCEESLLTFSVSRSEF